MSLAIAKAREAIASGQAPFGAVIVADGRVATAPIDECRAAGLSPPD